MGLFSPRAKVEGAVLPPAFEDRSGEARDLKLAGVGIPRFSIARADKRFPCPKGFDATGVQGMEPGHHNVSTIQERVHILLWAFERPDEGIPPTMLDEALEGLGHLAAWAVVEVKPRLGERLGHLLHG